MRNSKGHAKKKEYRFISKVQTLSKHYSWLPKNKDHKLQKSGIIFKFKCPHINFPEQYIGESGRTLGDRVKEHLRALSPIHQHSNTTGHPVSPDLFTIVHREPQGNTRNIKEAMFNQINDPSLNRNIGKY